METITRRNHKNGIITSVELKKKVIAERGRICEECGKDFSEDPTYYRFKNILILDHKIPIAIGGEQHTKGSVQLLCTKCNGKKTKIDNSIINSFKQMGLMSRISVRCWDLYIDKKLLTHEYLELKELCEISKINRGEEA